MKAVWKETVLAESADTVLVEGNHYFPADSLNPSYFRPSMTRSVCAWKGQACYYDVVVGDAINPDAAWYYPSATSEAKHIEGRVAFWHGVVIKP